MAEETKEATDWDWIEFFYHNEPHIKAGFDRLVHEMQKAGKDFALGDLMGLLGCPNARRKEDRDGAA